MLIAFPLPAPGTRLPPRAPSLGLARQATGAALAALPNLALLALFTLA